MQSLLTISRKNAVVFIALAILTSANDPSSGPQTSFKKNISLFIHFSVLSSVISQVIFDIKQELE